MTRYLPLCVSALLLASAEAEWVSDVFPEFADMKAEVAHYQTGKRAAFPRLDDARQRPDIEKWIEGLPLPQSAANTLSISVYRKDGRVRFVRERSDGEDAAIRLYRFSEYAIELILLLPDEQKLWSTQIGISRWVWKYDEDGKFIQSEHYRGNDRVERGEWGWDRVEPTTADADSLWFTKRPTTAHVHLISSWPTGAVPG